MTSPDAVLHDAVLATRPARAEVVALEEERRVVEVDLFTEHAILHTTSITIFGAPDNFDMLLLVCRDRAVCC